MEVQLVPATIEHQAVLENLLELYLHDFSEFIDLSVGEDGRFGYEYLEEYWKPGNGRRAFLIRSDGRLAGFALLQRGSEVSPDPEVLDVAEFFVLRGFRRAGIGLAAAHLLFRAYEGRWEVRVLESNAGAQRFWPRVVEAFTSEFEQFVHRRGDEARPVTVFRFHSPPG
ncbi:MAG: GNAT family N-acetyltransferase [Deltaproteobacteria bacterium]|nr:GNAT family N-acetyltransferase [Deltaproteobacteria bacterium]